MYHSTNDPSFARSRVQRGAKRTVPIGPASLTMDDGNHAIGLTLDNGIEILLHIGLDTVEMHGDGFDIHVKMGDRVKAGQQLITFDPEKIKAAGHPMITMMVITDDGGWNAVFWCNHDQPRVVSRFGDEGKYHDRSAKMLGTFVHLLRGTPYIFQGEEIGMTNAHFHSIEEYRDVECLNYYKILLDGGSTKEEALEVLANRARDNGRTPMQWDGTPNAGFTTGTPWIGVTDNYRTINVEAAEADPDSILHYYRRLIRLRKEYDVISEGDIRFLDTGIPHVLAYERIFEGRTLTVVCNFGSEREVIDIPELAERMENGSVLISSTGREIPSSGLEPYEGTAYIN